MGTIGHLGNIPRISYIEHYITLKNEDSPTEFTNNNRLSRSSLLFLFSIDFYRNNFSIIHATLLFSSVFSHIKKHFGIVLPIKRVYINIPK
jgi:hypothetical protein